MVLGSESDIMVLRSESDLMVLGSESDIVVLACLESSQDYFRMNWSWGQIDLLTLSLHIHRLPVYALTPLKCAYTGSECTNFFAIIKYLRNSAAIWHLEMKLEIVSFIIPLEFSKLAKNGGTAWNSLFLLDEVVDQVHGQWR
jgi:hypothetical protein